ncbi:MAG: cupredoxin domain-containing protein [Armatimonadota bacterium]|nr:cupredoxin domain-containing protein [Armatimonadota bacterium]
MYARLALVGTLVAAVTLGMVAAAPAQTTPPKRVIEVSMTSYKFEPSQLRVTEGETVVIRLKNVDPAGRRHNMASAYFATIPLTLRGDGEEGTNEGRKYVVVSAGKEAEFEFVARNRGSYAFICSLFDHAARGQTGTLIVQAPQ